MGLLDALGLRRRAYRGGGRKWICGRLESGKACRAGPTRRGACQAGAECVPAESGGEWRCRRPASSGGQCPEGPNADGSCRHPVPPCTPVRSMRARREALSVWLTVTVVGLLILTIAYGRESKVLMPGPITTAHSAIDKCSDCHSNITDGKLGWLHAVVAAARPDKDSAACLTCHKLGEAAMKPHSVPPETLKASSDRLKAVADSSPLPVSARMRNALFPAEDAQTRGVFCATCHKEHQGKAVDLKDMANARCQTCHAVQFDSFHKDHPEFDGWPFRRRTRLAFDHGSHFDKHFPETRAKAKQAKSIPTACADCHTTGADRRHMGVKPFESTCSTCHLDRIVGADRATGPKGIPLLALPGLDVTTLEEKKVVIGEWPELSEAEITPMMKLLIGWNEDGRKLLAKVDKLDLLDLTSASKQDIAAVETFAWSVKELIHALSTARASEVFGRLGSATGGDVDPSLLAKLTANMPRDVLVSAQRDWLPNLPQEMARRGRGEAPAGSSPPARKKAARAAKAARKRNETVVPSGRGRLRINVFGRMVRGPDDRPSADKRDKTEDAESEAAAPEPVAPVAVDAEAWAEFGGWYRQDFAILYKPTGHADRFLRAWLDFTGTLHGKSDTRLAASVFDVLTAKDAPGQCTRCHSVDAAHGQSRKINWRPSSLSTRASRFTSFVHEPHFGVVGDRGCLTCHDLSGAAGYQDAYKSLDPKQFVSNFKPIRRKQCAACHTKNASREDCLACHTYHGPDVITPILSTKVPDR